MKQCFTAVVSLLRYLNANLIEQIGNFVLNNMIFRLDTL